MLDADPIITADDVVRVGACADGVARVVKRLGEKAPAAMPASAILRLLRDDEKDYVLRAAKLDGSGSGDGSGYGDGSGFGSGSGSVYGDGYG